MTSRPSPGAFNRGVPLNEIELLVWNGFSTKRGLRDEATEALEKNKGDSGLEGRTDIQTFFRLFRGR